jgi:hypothetical protein
LFPRMFLKLELRQDSCVASPLAGRPVGDCLAAFIQQ